MEVICPCGKKFNGKPSRIKNGRAKYCSKVCMFKFKVRPQGLIYNIKVKNKSWFQKGNVPYNFGTKKPFEERLKLRKASLGKGFYLNYKGYKVVSILGQEILEHRLVMEKYLGRKLRINETIHHIDGNVQNNRLSNLLLLKNQSKHMQLHHKQRRLKCVLYS